VTGGRAGCRGPAVKLVDRSVSIDLRSVAVDRRAVDQPPEHPAATPSLAAAGAGRPAGRDA